MLRQRNVSKGSYFGHYFVFLDLLLEPQGICTYTELLKCSLNLIKFLKSALKNNNPLTYTYFDVLTNY